MSLITWRKKERVNPTFTQSTMFKPEKLDTKGYQHPDHLKPVRKCSFCCSLFSDSYVDHLEGHKTPVSTESISRLSPRLTRFLLSENPISDSTSRPRNLRDLVDTAQFTTPSSGIPFTTLWEQDALNHPSFARDKNQVTHDHKSE
jgi:hypothetical protein